MHALRRSASCPRCAWSRRALRTRTACGACRTRRPRSAPRRPSCASTMRRSSRSRTACARCDAVRPLPALLALIWGPLRLCTHLALLPRPVPDSHAGPRASAHLALLTGPVPKRGVRTCSARFALLMSLPSNLFMSRSSCLIKAMHAWGAKAGLPTVVALMMDSGRRHEHDWTVVACMGSAAP